MPDCGDIPDMSDKEKTPGQIWNMPKGLYTICSENASVTQEELLEIDTE